jgi:hypothetical protein
MKKVAVVLSSMMFLAVGTAFSAPITMKNSISFVGNPVDTVSTGDSIGRLIVYRPGHVNHLGIYADFIEWSHTFTYNQSADFQPSCNTVSPVPEPATMTLLEIGLLGAGLVSRKIKRKSESTKKNICIFILFIRECFLGGKAFPFFIISSRNQKIEPFTFAQVQLALIF